MEAPTTTPQENSHAREDYHNLLPELAFAVACVLICTASIQYRAFRQDSLASGIPRRIAKIAGEIEWGNALILGFLVASIASVNLWPSHYALAILVLVVCIAILFTAAYIYKR